jgi:hypothetical protein
MGLFLTLLYIFTAYMGPQTVWGPVAEFHIEIILAALAFVASLHGIQRSTVFTIPQTYALMGMCSAVIISGIMTGWLGSIPDSIFGFIPNAFTFFLIVVNCRSKRHLQWVIATFFIVSAHAILRGYAALHAGDYLNPYLMPQGEEGSASRFYRLRGMAFINDPNDFGQVLVSLVPCMLFFWKKGNPLRNFVFVLPSMALLVFGMYLTHSRGCMIALLAVILFLSRRKIGTIPAVIIAGAGFAASSALNWSGGRDVSVEAGAGRMEAWAVGLDLIKSHPLFGVGFGRFDEYFYITAHNTIVVCAAELGMYGLFWWVMFVLPTIRDSIACSASKVNTPTDDDFSYDQAFGVRRENKADLSWREPRQAAAESMVEVMVAEDSPARAVATPTHLVTEIEDEKLPQEEIQRISGLMLASIIGYFVAGWFLSRAYIMTLFIYGGMVQVIYRMALAQGMVPPRMRAFKVLQYSFAGAIGLILLVYVMLRGEHMMGVH